jgi:hypothetical protein
MVLSLIFKRVRRARKVLLKTPGRRRSVASIEPELPEENDAARHDTDRRFRRAKERTLRAFYKFVRWGEKQGAPFDSRTGAVEYAVKVANLVPECGDECILIADLFEEATFSNRGPTESVSLRIAGMVKQIIKRRRSRV